MNQHLAARAVNWREFLRLLQAADRSYSTSSGLVALRVGDVFSGVSLPAEFFHPVIKRLQGRREPIGPVLNDAAAHAVVFLLAARAAERLAWPAAAGVRVLAANEVVLCPPPGFTVRGRDWLVPPGGLSATDPAVLHQVLAAVVGDHRSQTPGWPQP
ncbi:hypothetical protein BIV57_13220 [Mangrovactinospora gilvigrisea]|uniref:Uncharacterized protein n=1 Tax=Mangrovactinospora gilvigrisea TaxID=1428644 RepID=A0A1J7C5Y8_9ACTN|nr:hypothetical protein [Mangrovactinospora gilvigrisea]OIV36948.1 hypothetical protein BIV57_13220 [Mangrovactinospora gilvigrisea]